ncbi:MAG: HIT domain-containing protein [Rhodospirillales bacterium]|jgi:diadenosine tetraphosphate (Ap4A) HIT family hydrolase|nr:HIT domain-containing protein [Rhodospirillales bacterium]MBT4038965.1 HIT domain-containing protein [Rhodospirillales bacterium]MBT4626637.1 HIT domain-containing protein [Rhodospirillales bacterium]MBT5351891.1 HIT domain-containing protein [Rhodospirillales bacterium]MBT5521587.1 HIT domain-containing protein [Rhodospirillales bacterium]
MFELDPRLENDTTAVTDLPLSRAVLMDDARYPWLILIPRIVGLTEIHDMSPAEIMQLTKEATTASRTLQSLTGAHKMNVATLGNVVSQLHVHVVARFEGDAAWPAPVWGVGEAEPYEGTVRAEMMERVKTELDLAFI